MTTLIKLLLIVSVFLLPITSLSWGQVFSEDFNTLQDSTAISTGNTNLTYVRVGNQGGGIVAQNPSSFAGTSTVIIGPSGGSLNGIGVGDTLPGSDIYTMSFDVSLQNSIGNIVFGLGSGTAFTGDSTFNTAHGLFWYQIQSGVLQRRLGGNWLNADSEGTLIEEAKYQVHVVANGSAASIEYAGRTLTAGTMDFYLNGFLVFDGVVVTNSLMADGFRIYSVNGANFELDNIKLWNSAQPIPEPSTYASIAGLLVFIGVVCFRRRPLARK